VSEHHRRAKASTHHPRLREQIAPSLPAPCVDCPHLVTPDQRWQVGHIIPLSRGGKTTRSNTGPSHSWCPTCRKRCNQVAGGRLGAAVTNAKTVSKRQASKDIRPW